MFFSKFSKFVGVILSFLFFTSSFALCMESAPCNEVHQLLKGIIEGIKNMKQQRDTLKQQVEGTCNQLKHIESLQVTNKKLEDYKNRLVEDMTTKESMINNIEAALNFKIGTTTFSELGNMSVKETDEITANLSEQEMNEILTNWLQNTLETHLIIAGKAKK
jgi:vancomycin resistance protein YoaR